MLITETAKIQNYYQALIERNSEFVGIFYVCVKTTSVFCIATCRARKPKFENVLFYTTFKGALEAGYRPCKVCKPTENSNEAPEPVLRAMKLVRDKPKEKLSDALLRQLNISPELVRRWFKKHYGMTFQAYQRMYRINDAFLELKSGKKSLETAYDSGYESLSGFGYTYKALIGSSPNSSADHKVILISRLTTPLGPMFVCSTDEGICLLEFIDSSVLEMDLKYLQQQLKTNIIAGENNHIKQVKIELQQYFEGKRKVFDVPLHTLGTNFQNLVFQSVRDIKYGESITYKELAELLNGSKEESVVATAMGENRIAMIVPCHRVVVKNAGLTDQGASQARNKWLIEHEKQHCADQNIKPGSKDCYP